MNVLEIQTKLKTLGFDPGTVDGQWGRNTMAAVKAFQASKGLDADGIVGPLTSNALGLSSPMLDVPPWFALAKTKMGLQEVHDKAALEAFLRSDGNTLGDPSKLPWCGDFAETCVAVTLPNEPMVANPYFALNWLKFGNVLSKETDFYLGAVAVFERPGGGHVAFIAGHDDSYVHTLGGNQSNSVSISRVAKERLAGIRWPHTYPMPSGTPLPITTFDGTITNNEA